jgi:hypothetical protein
LACVYPVGHAVISFGVDANDHFTPNIAAFG